MGLIVKFAEGKTIPEGPYNAKLSKLEKQNHPQWGEGIRWTFDITDGDNAGVSVTAMSSTKVSPKSKIYNWVQSFGVVLSPGEEFDLESLIGKAVRVRVKNKTTSKVVDGKTVEMTFSNVDALAPAQADQVTPTEQSTTPAPAEKSSTDGFATSGVLDDDQDFNF